MKYIIGMTYGKESEDVMNKRVGYDYYNLLLGMKDNLFRLPIDDKDFCFYILDDKTMCIEKRHFLQIGDVVTTAEYAPTELLSIYRISKLFESFGSFKDDIGLVMTSNKIITEMDIPRNGLCYYRVSDCGKYVASVTMEEPRSDDIREEYIGIGVNKQLLVPCVISIFAKDRGLIAQIKKFRANNINSFNEMFSLRLESFKVVNADTCGYRGIGYFTNVDFEFVFNKGELFCDYFNLDADIEKNHCTFEDLDSEAISVTYSTDAYDNLMATPDKFEILQMQAVATSIFG